jgi:hypothetical protein|tara:strand:- start:680 stop:1015 length:336 start_codon:yes stop_codon:yes gene_type:complete
MPIRHRNLPETCTIQTVSETAVDERGLPSSSWADTYTSVKAKFESQGIEEDRDGRNTTVETFGIYIEPNVTVVPGDRLVKGSEYHEIISVQQVKDRYGKECYKYLESLVRT